MSWARRATLDEEDHDTSENALTNPFQSDDMAHSSLPPMPQGVQFLPPLDRRRLFASDRDEDLANLQDQFLRSGAAPSAQLMRRPNPTRPTTQTSQQQLNNDRQQHLQQRQSQQEGRSITTSRRTRDVIRLLPENESMLSSSSPATSVSPSSSPSSSSSSNLTSHTQAPRPNLTTSTTIIKPSQPSSIQDNSFSHDEIVAERKAKFDTEEDVNNYSVAVRSKIERGERPAATVVRAVRKPGSSIGVLATSTQTSDRTGLSTVNVTANMATDQGALVSSSAPTATAVAGVKEIEGKKPQPKVSLFKQRKQQEASSNNPMTSGTNSSTVKSVRFVDSPSPTTSTTPSTAHVTSISNKPAEPVGTVLASTLKPISRPEMKTRLGTDGSRYLVPRHGRDAEVTHMAAMSDDDDDDDNRHHQHHPTREDSGKERMTEEEVADDYERNRMKRVMGGLEVILPQPEGSSETSGVGEGNAVESMITKMMGGAGPGIIERKRPVSSRKSPNGTQGGALTDKPIKTGSTSTPTPTTPTVTTPPSISSPLSSLPASSSTSLPSPGGIIERRRQPPSRKVAPTGFPTVDVVKLPSSRNTTLSLPTSSPTTNSSTTIPTQSSRSSRSDDMELSPELTELLSNLNPGHERRHPALPTSSPSSSSSSSSSSSISSSTAPKKLSVFARQRMEREAAQSVKPMNNKANDTNTSTPSSSTPIVSSIPNPSSSYSSSRSIFSRVSANVLREGDSETISKANDDILAGMGADEIAEMQRELLSALDPSLIAAIRSGTLGKGKAGLSSSDGDGKVDDDAGDDESDDNDDDDDEWNEDEKEGKEGSDSNRGNIDDVSRPSQSILGSTAPLASIYKRRPKTAAERLEEASTAWLKPIDPSEDALVGEGMVVPVDSVSSLPTLPLPPQPHTGTTLASASTLTTTSSHHAGSSSAGASTATESSNPYGFVVKSSGQVRDGVRGGVSERAAISDTGVTSVLQLDWANFRVDLSGRPFDGQDGIHSASNAYRKQKRNNKEEMSKEGERKLDNKSSPLNAISSDDSKKGNEVNDNDDDLDNDDDDDDDDVLTTEGLHHHGDQPGRPGYTLNELAHLARSSLPSQRATAAQALIGVVTRARSHCYTYILHDHIDEGEQRLKPPSANSTAMKKYKDSRGVGNGVATRRIDYSHNVLGFLFQRCSLVFLARSLLDDVNASVVAVALDLIHALTSPDIVLQAEGTPSLTTPQQASTSPSTSSSTTLGLAIPSPLYIPDLSSTMTRVNPQGPLPLTINSPFPCIAPSLPDVSYFSASTSSSTSTSTSSSSLFSPTSSPFRIHPTDFYASRTTFTRPSGESASLSSRAMDISVFDEGVHGQLALLRKQTEDLKLKTPAALNHYALKRAVASGEAGGKGAGDVRDCGRTISNIEDVSDLTHQMNILDAVKPFPKSFSTSSHRPLSNTTNNTQPSASSTSSSILVEDEDLSLEQLGTYDVVAVLLAMGILPRLRYLLQNACDKAERLAVLVESGADEVASILSEIGPPSSSLSSRLSSATSRLRDSSLQLDTSLSLQLSLLRILLNLAQHSAKSLLLIRFAPYLFDLLKSTLSATTKCASITLDDKHITTALQTLQRTQTKADTSSSPPSSSSSSPSPSSPISGATDTLSTVRVLMTCISQIERLVAVRSTYVIHIFTLLCKLERCFAVDMFKSGIHQLLKRFIIRAVDCNLLTTALSTFSPQSTLPSTASPSSPNNATNISSPLASFIALDLSVPLCIISSHISRLDVSSAVGRLWQASLAHGLDVADLLHLTSFLVRGMEAAVQSPYIHELTAANISPSSPSTTSSSALSSLNPIIPHFFSLLDHSVSIHARILLSLLTTGESIAAVALATMSNVPLAEEIKKVKRDLGVTSNPSGVDDISNESNNKKDAGDKNEGFGLVESESAPITLTHVAPALVRCLPNALDMITSLSSSSLPPLSSTTSAPLSSYPSTLSPGQSHFLAGLLHASASHLAALAIHPQLGLPGLKSLVYGSSSSSSSSSSNLHNAMNTIDESEAAKAREIIGEAVVDVVKLLNALVPLSSSQAQLKASSLSRLPIAIAVLRLHLSISTLASPMISSTPPSQVPSNTQSCIYASPSPIHEPFPNMPLTTDIIPLLSHLYHRDTATYLTRSSPSTPSSTHYLLPYIQLDASATDMLTSVVRLIRSAISVAAGPHFSPSPSPSPSASSSPVSLDIALHWAAVLSSTADLALSSGRFYPLSSSPSASSPPTPSPSNPINSVGTSDLTLSRECSVLAYETAFAIGEISLYLSKINVSLATSTSSTSLSSTSSFPSPTISLPALRHYSTVLAYRAIPSLLLYGSPSLAHKLTTNLLLNPHHLSPILNQPQNQTAFSHYLTSLKLATLPLLHVEATSRTPTPAIFRVPLSILQGESPHIVTNQSHRYKSPPQSQPFPMTESLPFAPHRNTLIPTTATKEANTSDTAPSSGSRNGTGDSHWLLSVIVDDFMSDTIASSLAIDIVHDDEVVENDSNTDNDNDNVDAMTTASSLPSFPSKRIIPSPQLSFPSASPLSGAGHTGWILGFASVVKTIVLSSRSRILSTIATLTSELDPTDAAMILGPLVNAHAQSEVNQSRLLASALKAAITILSILTNFTSLITSPSSTINQSLCDFFTASIRTHTLRAVMELCLLADVELDPLDPRITQSANRSGDMTLRMRQTASVMNSVGDGVFGTSEMQQVLLSLLIDIVFKDTTAPTKYQGTHASRCVTCDGLGMVDRLLDDPYIHRLWLSMSDTNQSNTRSPSSSNPSSSSSSSSSSRQPFQVVASLQSAFYSRICTLIDTFASTSAGSPLQALVLAPLLRCDLPYDWRRRIWQLILIPMPRAFTGGYISQSLSTKTTTTTTKATTATTSLSESSSQYEVSDDVPIVSLSGVIKYNPILPLYPAVDQPSIVHASDDSSQSSLQPINALSVRHLAAIREPVPELVSLYIRALKTTHPTPTSAAPSNATSPPLPYTSIDILAIIHVAASTFGKDGMLHNVDISDPSLTGAEPIDDEQVKTLAVLSGMLDRDTFNMIVTIQLPSSSFMPASNTMTTLPQDASVVSRVVRKRRAVIETALSSDIDDEQRDVLNNTLNLLASYSSL